MSSVRTSPGVPLATIAAVTALLLSACGSGAREPVTVSLGELVAEQERYQGSSVRTQGTVEAFGDDPDDLHYVVKDDRSNRVQVLPEDVAEQFVGREVIVVGRFDFGEEVGRVIRVESIEPAG